MLQAARDHEVSWPVVQAAFAAHAAVALPAVTPEVECPGIDETRRGKAKYRLNAAEDGREVAAGRWHAGFAGLGGGAGLLGQVEGRSAAIVPAWTDAQSRAWRDAVAFAATGMCTIFKAAVRVSLPNAALVAGRFHVAQLANAALTEVRRRVTAVSVAAGDAKATANGNCAAG